ncbi:hypothetical protein RHGRI_023848 [Rhododendron griersonianum]|uniref:Uncharacterized protein n=1 Tax=Rhododendron griersonianum TaxID=479676 RepID=A0AAV6JCA2_9ERIC|nr:hypothetical protein RHGRI_023848 [Rhododendron griersonianum]
METASKTHPPTLSEYATLPFPHPQLRLRLSSEIDGAAAFQKRRPNHQSRPTASSANLCLLLPPPITASLYCSTRDRQRWRRHSLLSVFPLPPQTFHLQSPVVAVLSRPVATHTFRHNLVKRYQNQHLCSVHDENENEFNLKQSTAQLSEQRLPSGKENSQPQVGKEISKSTLAQCARRERERILKQSTTRQSEQHLLGDTRIQHLHEINIGAARDEHCANIGNNIRIREDTQRADTTAQARQKSSYADKGKGLLTYTKEKDTSLTIVGIL